ncbi:MAG: aminoglycoside phosphotransferase family protein [Peptococcaceae bacterium]|nr:aminoglycoside phosphotransferase family protein [Peptococcaceae bacterium]
MALSEQLLPDIKKYVQNKDFCSALSVGREIEVDFLAQGEYNINYLLHTSGGKFVLRVNTGSQIKVDNQIAYEYKALELLKTSGVTPIPYYLDDSKEKIPYGLLVMEYLPGEPLDYSSDLNKAAATFARIHSLTFAKGQTDFLIQTFGPFSGIFAEAAGYLEKYFNFAHADAEVARLLEKLLLHAEEKKKQEDFLIPNNSPQAKRAVINTEVNSHNFIVNKNRQTCHLIDWEKPILGEPAQDLSMFLIPTTTLWKRNYILSPQEEKEFIQAYEQQLMPGSQDPHLKDKIEMFKFFNLLRAISWCAMAWTEYVSPGRLVVNQDTFEKIKLYIQTDFIKRCFAQVFAK